MEIKQLTLRIPEIVHVKLKTLAGITRKSMTDILIECVEERYKSAGLPEPKIDNPDTDEGK